MGVTRRRDLLTRLSGVVSSLRALYVKMVKKVLTTRIVPTWTETLKRWRAVEKPGRSLGQVTHLKLTGSQAAFTE